MCLCRPITQSLTYNLDLSPNNILLGVDDPAALDKVEQAELKNPSPRKVLPRRTIYLSYTMPITYGAPVISDFGAARLGGPGQKHTGDVMPGVYRAPEIIVGAEWDSKIDIWSVGVMVGRGASSSKRWACLTVRNQVWDLFEGGRLFRAVKDGHLNDEQHLAEMVSLLGPPPKKFLQMSKKCRQYWDSEGRFPDDDLQPDRCFRNPDMLIDQRQLDCCGASPGPVFRES